MRKIKRITILKSFYLINIYNNFNFNFFFIIIYLFFFFKKKKRGISIYLTIFNINYMKIINKTNIKNT